MLASFGESDPTRSVFSLLSVSCSKNRRRDEVATGLLAMVQRRTEYLPALWLTELPAEPRSWCSARPSVL